MTRTANAVPLPRAAVLAYRSAAHQLDDPAEHPGGCAVLSAGVQDHPTGASAHLALRPRLRGSVDELVGSGALALAYTARASLHLHRSEDLALVAAAVRPVDAADQAKEFGPWGADLVANGITADEALDQVAAAMAEVGRGRDVVSKGELSTAVRTTVDKRLLVWCEGCGVHHVSDALFRYAATQAEFRVVRERSGPTQLLPGPFLGPRPEPATARRELLRRYLRLAGVANPKQVAGWLALTPRAVRDRWWPADELVEVDVEGRRAWAHGDDVEAIVASEPAPRVRLLPPYDPLLELGDRTLLVPSTSDRQQVWRPTASPGVLVVAGEIAGTWRQRTSKQVVALTVRGFGRLADADRAALDAEAERLAAALGAPAVRVAVAGS